MAHIDKQQLDDMWRITRAGKARQILLMLKKVDCLTYLELSSAVNLDIKKRKSGLFAYYLRKLSKAKLVKVEHRQWYLTRAGLQMMKVITRFENLCMTYDMADVDADGIIKAIVVRDNGYGQNKKNQQKSKEIGIAN